MGLMSFGCGWPRWITRRMSASGRTRSAVFEQYRKLRNTLRYMVGNVADVPEEGSSDFAAYDASARYDSTSGYWVKPSKCYDAYDQYQFQRAVNALSAFATNELSTLYLDVRRIASTCRRRAPAGGGGRARAFDEASEYITKIAGAVTAAPRRGALAGVTLQAGDAFSSERGSVFGLAEPWTRVLPICLHDEAKWTRGGNCEMMLMTLGPRGS